MVKFPYLEDYIQEDCLQLSRGLDHWTPRAEESNTAIQGSLASIQKPVLRHQEKLKGTNKSPRKEKASEITHVPS